MLAAIAIIALALIADSAIHLAHAQGSPFSGQRTGMPQPTTGIVGWLFEKQAEFYKQISAAIRATKTDSAAIWTMIGVCFAYGVFHAAGPGHGKAVISSYLIANEETARRGVVLSFASALLQAIVAIALVGLGRLVFNAAASTMCSAEHWVEVASYGLIALVGARLCWTKGRGLLDAVAGWRAAVAPALVPALAFEAAAGAGRTPHAAHGDGHHHHDHGHDHHDHDHGHDHTHDDPHHVHDEHCGHNHGPAPSELAGPGGWQRGFSAIVAAGLRPCSGAILVLVFAFAQSLYGAGIAATFAMAVGTGITVATIAIVSVSAKGLARRLLAHREGFGMLALRGLEFGAAGVVLLFGAALLSGYLVAERATCF